MFTDLKIARRNAYQLSRTLMVATMVIMIGSQYSVIAAEDHEHSLIVINEYDPFG